MLNWISNNPSAFASLVSAVIAASVALAVFSLSQFITKKRERTQFLTPKLEELYLLLNQVSEDNARFFKLIYQCLIGETNAKQEIEAIDDLEIYGHRTAKRIIMYIRLYFPRLSKIHQKLFAAQRELNQYIFQVHTDKPPDLSDVVQASGKVGHFIRLMEEEIIRNRDYLLCDYYFFKNYKITTKDEIETEIPHPDGPTMNLS
jgi:hypothetical protein